MESPSKVAAGASTDLRAKALRLTRDPADAPAVLTAREAAERWRAHPLSIAEPILRDLLGEVHYESDQEVVVRGADGALLWIDGKPAVFDPEEILAGKRPGGWSLGAAPVRDPSSGELLGAIDLSGDLAEAHPHSLALVSAAAQLVEAEFAVRLARAEVESLRAQTPPEIEVLRIEALGRKRADIIRGDERITLSRRHSEIVAMLVLHPDLEDGRLARELYGEGGAAMTARSELSRLRRILGERLPSTARRLDGVVECDFGELETALDCDDIDRAIALWRGELLPGSTVPLIVEARERLELRLRDLLLSRPGTALLKRWLETGAGRDDIEAARELIRRLAPDDPAHAAAASRLRRLSRS